MALINDSEIEWHVPVTTTEGDRDVDVRFNFPVGEEASVDVVIKLSPAQIVELQEQAHRLMIALGIAAADPSRLVDALERARGYVQDLALRLGVEAW